MAQRQLTQAEERQGSEERQGTQPERQGSQPKGLTDPAGSIIAGSHRSGSGVGGAAGTGIVAGTHPGNEQCSIGSAMELQVHQLAALEPHTRTEQGVMRFVHAHTPRPSVQGPVVQSPKPQELMIRGQTPTAPTAPTPTAPKVADGATLAGELPGQARAASQGLESQESAEQHGLLHPSQRETTAAMIPERILAAPVATSPVRQGDSSSPRDSPDSTQGAGASQAFRSANSTTPGGDPQLASESTTAEQLTLADVIASTYRAFPLIQQARLEGRLAAGEITSAWGAFDTRLSANSLSEPTGFYQNYRNGLGVIRRTWWGGYVEAGYRLGTGDFAPWYKERQTNRGGEFGVGLGFPLLQGRAIDAQRVAIFQAGLSQQAVGPQVQLAVLENSLLAAAAYWEWIAAGARLGAQVELLDLAIERQKQFEIGAKAGKFPKIDVVFNNQLVAERAAKRTQAEQKFRAASFKLSLFLRDESGTPLIPDDPWLPKHFPIIDLVKAFDFSSDYQAALLRRPELTLLAIETQQVQMDRRLAINQRLPALDIVSEASQDVGEPVSSSNDKGRFELLVGVQSDFPIQRRNALGKIQQTSAKISQLEQKITLQRDKIGIELRTAQNALILAGQQVEQVEVALRAAFESLQAFRFAFEKGYADLLYLNILETKTNEVEIDMIDAQRDWFIALAETQAASGLDPLEQALSVATLPESKRLGPGDMPRLQPSGAEAQRLEEDLKRAAESKPAREGPGN